MLWIIIILAIVGIIVFIISQKSSSNSEPISDGYKYKAKQLMTANEFEFFNRLVQALPEYYVFPQVSMGAVLSADSSDFKQRNKIRLTFAQKIIDYVIYDKKQNIVAIIELDDKTHNQEKDDKRDAMLLKAGYKILRFNSKNKPSVEELKKAVG